MLLLARLCCHSSVLMKSEPQSQPEHSRLVKQVLVHHFDKHSRSVNQVLVYHFDFNTYINYNIPTLQIFGDQCIKLLFYF